jgi:hypothetical protein
LRVLVAEDERPTADAIAAGLRRRAMAVDVSATGTLRRKPGQPPVIETVPGAGADRPAAGIPPPATEPIADRTGRANRSG